VKVFFDTCVLAALTVPEDLLNPGAKIVYKKITQMSFRQFTSDYVLDEVYTLLSARRGHHRAVAFMDAFDRSGVEILRVERSIELDAKNIFRKYDLPRLSFTDCASFALINFHRIDHVFSFDEHFSMFRFNHPVTLLGRVENCKW